MGTGDLQRAVALALEGTVMLDEAEQSARQLCTSLDQLLLERAHRLHATDVPRLLAEIEAVVRGWRLASAHVEAAFRFAHQVAGGGAGQGLTALEADALLPLSLRSFASQRRTSDLIEAAVHAVRESLPAQELEARVTRH